jgi:hypothetical protein
MFSQAFKDWMTTAGTQNFFYKNVTKTDGSGNVYVAGATMNGAGNYDILLAKFNSSGIQQWIQQVNGSANGQDFATALHVDGSGNVYITGCITNDTATMMGDLFIKKYNSSGTIQWTNTYDGYNLYDCGTDIYVAAGGSLAVVGSSYNASVNLDFVTILYNSSGVQQWATRYAHASGGNDVPVQIAKKGAGMVVSGAVQTGVGTYSWAAISYSNTGVFQSSIISSGGTTGIEEVRAMVTDANGYIYLAGFTPTVSNGYDYDIIKLDSNLVIQWEETYNGIDSLDDKANGIQVSPLGDVYVTGYSKSTAGQCDYMTLKYNSSGTLIWAERYNDSLNGYDEAYAIALDTNDNVYVTGAAYRNSLQKGNYHTIKYDSSGTKIWSVDFNGAANLSDQAIGIAINTVGDVIVTGQSETSPGVYEYVTVKYIENIIPPSHAELGATIDINGEALTERGVAIVRFNPDYLRMKAIDNRDIECSHASTFVEDTLLYTMGQELFTGTPDERLQKMRNVTTRKIFSRMASADSVSTTRSGEKIKVPPFWATLLLYFDANEYIVCHNLKDIFPQIFYAHPNFIGIPFSVPDDSSYTSQASLAPTVSYPNGHINVEPAWDIETGKKFVKVGVYDVGIDSLHPDIAVAYRMDIENLLTGSTVGGHGSPVAGIIGAKRNNNMGIAGIAGGNDSDSTGCSVYDIDIGADNGIFVSEAAEGIIVGAGNYYYSSIPTPFIIKVEHGLSLDIMNHSWGSYLDDFTRDEITDEEDLPVPNTNCNLCLEAIEFAYRNGVITTASRGNWKYVMGSAALPTDAKFPGCSQDEMVLNVGSVGTDGQHKNTANGAYMDGTDTYTSMYGHDVDIVAPGTKGTVYTTRSQTVTPFTQLYSPFSGTSSAAPHAAGVAALMLSHVNTPCPSEKNLTQEDVEYILQKTANDRVPSGLGYDDTTGYGLLDAGAALAAIEEPKYQIIHINNNPVTISTVFDDTASLYLHAPYRQGGGYGPYANTFPLVPEGEYFVQRYKTTATINHSANLAHLTGTAEILAAWERNSASIGLDKHISYGISSYWVHDTLNATSHVILDTFTATTATFTTYTYYVTTSIDGLVTVNKWYPRDSTALKFSYSIYVHDTAANSVPYYPCDSTVGIANPPKPLSGNSLLINNIYPVPATDNLTIEYTVMYDAEATISIMDLLGRTVQNPEIYSRNAGNYKASINISNLAKGCYVFQVRTKKEKVQRKFLIVR